MGILGRTVDVAVRYVHTYRCTCIPDAIVISPDNDVDLERGAGGFLTSRFESRLQGWNSGSVSVRAETSGLVRTGVVVRPVSSACAYGLVGRMQVWMCKQRSCAKERRYRKGTEHFIRRLCQVILGVES
jgi:hypothetical protein